jgi:hypothetical protein
MPSTGGLAVVRPRPLVCDQPRGISLLSDLHIGAANTDYGRILAELERADEAGDRILLGGDVFDLILPGDRKRFRPGKLHPRLQGRDDIVNAAVDWAVELLKPYEGLIDAIGVGNHESSTEQHHSLDAVRLLVDRLNAPLAGMTPRAVPIAQLGYTGYLDYQIRAAPEARLSSGRYVVWYTHGAGRISSAPKALEKLLGSTRTFAADLYWTGHSHARAHCTEVMIHCDSRGRVVGRDVKCIVTGGYMHAYGGQSQASIKAEGRKSNYAAEGALMPHGLGGARVVLHWEEPGFPSRIEVVQ